MSQNPMQTGLSQFELCKALYQSGVLSQVKLSPSSKLVLIGLANHFNPNKNDMFPSQNYLSEHLGVSVKSIQRAIIELSQKGLVVYDTKTVNHYVFTKKFFEMINLDKNFCKDKMSDNMRQTVCNKSVKLSPKHEREHEKNKSNFYKKASQRPPYHAFGNQKEGISIRGVDETKEILRQTFDVELKSPMDDLQTAKNWLNALTHEELRHSFIEEKALKIRNRWGL